MLQTKEYLDLGKSNCPLLPWLSYETYWWL